MTTLSSADVKNEWIYDYVSSYTFMAQTEKALVSSEHCHELPDIDQLDRDCFVHYVIFNVH